MLTFFAFLLCILGSLNWLSIGLFQYDFVAGLFGYQASIFSRMVYIIVGSAVVVLLVSAIKNKGVLPVFKFKKKDKKKDKESESYRVPAHANVEASSEFNDRDRIKREYERQKNEFDDYSDAPYNNDDPTERKNEDYDSKSHYEHNIFDERYK